MDINAAYREVGTYRGAAEICSTTPKTVKRVVEARGAHRRRSAAVAHNYDLVARARRQHVSKRPRAASRPSGSCRRHAPPAMRAPPATSGVSWPTRRPLGEPTTTGGGVPGSGSRATCSSSTGARSAAARLLRGARPGAAVRFVLLLRQRAIRDDAGVPGRVLRVPGRRAEGRAGRSHGLSQGRRRRQRRHPDPCLCPLRRALRLLARTSARPHDPESKGLVENLVGYVKSDLMIPERAPVAELAGRTTRPAPGATR